jgi:hypothetical protein
MHGSRSKIPSKNLVRQRCAEGFNSGVKGLIISYRHPTEDNVRSIDIVILHYRKHAIALKHSIFLPTNTTMYLIISGP